MRPRLFGPAAVGFVATLASLAFAAPVAADPMEPIPGDGFFLVGPDIGSTDVVVGHFRPGSGGQRPPRVSMAMAMSASGLWNP